MNVKYDKVIIGAGIYGLYAAYRCGTKGENVLVIEKELKPFLRASYINQARVHMGYHYPRSLYTAKKSANYFNQFVEEFKSSIYKDFKQIYATSSKYSYTNREQFIKFCEDANIFCEEIIPDKYFKKDVCDGCFLTKEYTFDAELLKKEILERISNIPNVTIKYSTQIINVKKNNFEFELTMSNQETISSKFVLNATYAAINQINSLFGYPMFDIKYELCEVILCNVSNKFKGVGLTVMDGPFFSIMPFGKTNLHSLTSVVFTPHSSCSKEFPEFSCQNQSKGYCDILNLGNCNLCGAHPQSAWPYMSTLAKKYLQDDMQFKYEKSLYSIKPILKNAEVTDSRPTYIKVFSENPKFVSVLSGKINTIYDLEEVLNEK